MTSAVTASAAYKDRELPIYSVDTQEKKVALRLDATWGSVRLMEVGEYAWKRGYKSGIISLLCDWLE